MIELNTVYNEDCLETMKRMADKSVDLVLTDPPYGIGISSNPIRQKHTRKEWDNEIPMDLIFKEIFRISKYQIIWGGNYFNLPPSKNFIIWDKKQSYDFSLAMCEYAYSSFDFPAKMYSYSNRGDEEKFHPSQKPIELMNFCLNFALERDENIKNIYDPFSGSGTTLVVAKSRKIDFIGSELDKDYYEIIQKRLQTVQGSLF
jgi:DNA modification methylase